RRGPGPGSEEGVDRLPGQACLAGEARNGDPRSPPLADQPFLSRGDFQSLTRNPALALGPAELDASGLGLGDAGDLALSPDPGQIAAALAVPCSTVRRLIRRFRQRGFAGLDPDYRQAPDLAGSASDLVRAVLRSRREHPTWGAALIRLHLLQEAWGEPVPSAR